MSGTLGDEVLVPLIRDERTVWHGHRRHDRVDCEMPGRGGRRATRIPYEIDQEESVAPLAVAPAELLRAEAGRVRNGHLLLALSWFTLHRAAIEAQWKRP